MAKVIAVLATLDTKGQEAQFLREQLKELGSKAVLIDMGVLGEPAIKLAKTDCTREQVAKAGGTAQSRPHRTAVYAMNPAGWREGRRTKAPTSNSTQKAPSTTQPCQVAGGPQPQP